MTGRRSGFGLSGASSRGTARVVAARTRGGVVTFLLGCLAMYGCTVEPRDGGVQVSSEVIEPSETEPARASEEDLASSALRTAEMFRSLVAAGDLSRALVLVDRDATLVDPLAGEAAEAATRGELVVDLRRRHVEGMSLEVMDTQVHLLTEGVAVVITQLAMLETDADGIGEETGRVHETLILEAQTEGWRILRLHRSLVPGT